MILAASAAVYALSRAMASSSRVQRAIVRVAVSLVASSSRLRCASSSARRSSGIAVDSVWVSCRRSRAMALASRQSSQRQPRAYLVSVPCGCRGGVQVGYPWACLHSAMARRLSPVARCMARSDIPALMRACKSVMPFKLCVWYAVEDSRAYREVPTRRFRFGG